VPIGIWLEFDYNDTSLSSLQSKQPAYLYSCLAVRISLTMSLARSSSSLTLFRPTVTSRLKITERYFHHQAPVSWDTNFLLHSHSQLVTLLRSYHFLLSHHLNLVLVLKLFFIIHSSYPSSLVCCTYWTDISVSEPARSLGLFISFSIYQSLIFIFIH